MRIRAWFLLTFLFCGALAGTTRAQAETAAPAPGIAKDLFTSIEGEDEDLYPANREQLRKRGMRFVSDKYGHATLTEGEFSYASDERFKPWSSWFFPLAKEELFHGENSPLAKFDTAINNMTGGQTRTRAAEFHARNVHNADASDWAGFCAPLAYASVFDGRLRAIKTPKLVHGVCFTPYDLKALSLLTYENVDASQWDGRFGQRFENVGPHARGAVARDIYPAEWHRFVQVQLGERKVPFIMDDDASPAVWKYAVYRAQGRVNRDPARANVALVTMTVHYARTQLTQRDRARDRAENVLTVPESKTYFYEVYGAWQGQTFRVLGSGLNGRWAGKQRLYHPDFVEELPGDGDIVGKGAAIINARRGSTNPELRVPLVDTLLNEALSAPACDPGR